MQLPHSRTWKDKNDDIKNDCHNRNEDNRGQEIVICRTVCIIFLVGRIYFPFATEGGYFGEKEGQGDEVGAD